jgi:hypothetical protein
MKGQTSLVDQFGFTCTPPKKSAHAQEALLDATLGSNDGMSPDEQVSIMVVPEVGSPSSEIMLLIPDEQVSMVSKAGSPSSETLPLIPVPDEQVGAMVPEAGPLSSETLPLIPVPDEQVSAMVPKAGPLSSEILPLVPDEQVSNLDEDWEDELDLRVGAGLGTGVKGWEELHEQVKGDLKKKAKTLGLSQLNQLMIIQNFTTLHLRGQGWMGASYEIARQWHEGEGLHFACHVRALAWHYQIFEQLPKEHHGGVANSRSLLEDESVHGKVQSWLTSQPTGQITPCGFQIALNDTILPFLSMKGPLSERTACHWLIKMGWRLTHFHQGVYKDGHERSDVVKDRQECFLPQMAQWEARMVHFEGPDLTRVDPQLLLGEREVIPCFHNECCFHANDFKARAWYVCMFALSTCFDSRNGQVRRWADEVEEERPRLAHTCVRFHHTKDWMPCSTG